ncbi:MAG: transglutaminase domain-containing protein [Lachnospiraceae bacterium]|nr:transglutaminase domain-containing protein [Lachnospiraceae bacterium]
MKKTFWMHKRAAVKPLLMIALSVWVLWGCTADILSDRESGEDNGALSETTEIIESEQNVTDTDIAETDASAQETSETNAVNTEVLPADVETLQSAQQGLYSFEMLSEVEKKVYAEVLYTMEHLYKEVTVSTLDTELLGKVFQCVLNDHPEIFYVDGYTYTRFTQGDTLIKIAFAPTYNKTSEEVATAEEQIAAYVNTCLQVISSHSSDYEKVKYVYEYLITHTEYDLEAVDNQNICSVFIGGRSVCMGYAKATQYLLRELGMEAVLITGTVYGGEGHGWNLVRLDGAYYFVDTTWGDASYQMSEEADNGMVSRIPAINYDYLCVTTGQLTRTHVISNVVPVAECTQLTDNYYVREDAYFESMDADKLEALFTAYYAAGREYVTCKCADEAVYSQMKQYLLGDQHIFDYLESDENSVAYADSDDQLSISFWL